MSIDKKYICTFCDKTFKTKHTLEYHQQTTKFCLEKQGVINTTFKCNYCDKILTTQSRLNSHLNVCKSKMKADLSAEKNDEKYEMESLLKQKDAQLKEYYESIIQYKEREKERDEYIKELKEMLEKANQTIAEIAMQPKTMNNNSDNRVHNQSNHITNNFDINDITKISRVLDNHLTTDVLRRGQEGLAEMLKTHLLQTETGEPMYECTDVARQKFEFRNADGNIETDPQATKLIRNLGRSGVWNKAHSTGKKLWEKEDGSVNYEAQNVFMPQVTEVLEIDKDSSKLRRRLASITARQRAPPSKSR